MVHGCFYGSRIGHPMMFKDLLDVLGLGECGDAIRDVMIKLHLKNPFCWA